MGFDGKVTVKPGSGDIVSKQAFCDIQLHLEWQTPQPLADMKSQQRNNSQQCSAVRCSRAGREQGGIYA